MKKRTLKEYFKSPDTALFLLFLVLFLVFMAFDQVVRTYDLFYSLPDVDIPLHFISGVALFVGIFWAFTFTKVKNKFKFSMAGFFLVAVLWEILEIIEEIFIYNPVYLQDFFFWDGFFDIVVHLIGGLVGYWLIIYLKTKTSFLDKENL